MDKIYIKNKHMFKNKWQMVIYILLFILIIYAFIYIGTKNFKVELPDNQKFAQEFSRVSLNNVFVYGTASDVRMVASGLDGIVLFGTSNEWVNYYADIVNEAAKEVGVEKIIYYDFLKNRQDNNGTYEDIVEKLSNFAVVNDRGKKEIYAPTLLVIKNNRIIYYDSETSFVSGNTTPNGYWSTYKRFAKIEEIKEVFERYMEG